jgi:hypothetical protein
MKSYKPRILDWLSSLVNHKFKHHHSDNWIIVSIWDDVLTITLDFRQPNQLELFNKLPTHLKGCLQIGTNKLVNEKTLYFKVSEICNVNYPDIIWHKLINKTKHQSGSKGWTDTGDFFYTYKWELFLSDNTSIMYSNQRNKMDMVKGNYIYNKTIQEREFKKFIMTF